MKRNLTGIYILDENREPTCFEDCKESKQNEWLETLDREQLINLAKKLADTIKEIGDTFDLIRD